MLSKKKTRFKKQ